MRQFEKMIEALTVMDGMSDVGLPMKQAVVNLQLSVYQIEGQVLQELLAYGLVKIHANEETVFINEAKAIFSARHLPFSEQLKLFIQPVLRRYQDETSEVFLLMLENDFVLQECEIPTINRPIVELLLDVKLFTKEKRILRVDPTNPIFLKWLVGNAFSEEDLMKLKLIQKELGNRAEEIALDFERNRLRGLGLQEEANKCELIAKTYLSAGFDLKSFSSPGNSHNRFIEVKAFDYEYFYLSKSERKKAMELKDTYFLYLVDTQSAAVEIIQNPIENLDEHFEQEVMDIRYHLKQ